jgi:hypothetical protein
MILVLWESTWRKAGGPHPALTPVNSKETYKIKNNMNRNKRSQFMAEKSSKGSGKPIPKIEINLVLSPEQGEKLLKTLQVRFEENMDRHKGLESPKIQARLEAHPEKLSSLNAMESTGGEPDVVGYGQKTGEYIFYDCSAESSKGRRSICYDREGQEQREKKGVHPAGNAVDLAAAMGLELLN